MKLIILDDSVKHFKLFYEAQRRSIDSILGNDKLVVG